MRRSIFSILAAGALIVSFVTSFIPQVQADPAPLTREFSAVVLGDSYSAGNGTAAETDITSLLKGSGISQSDQYYYGPPGSYRSRLNWAHDYVNWLNEQPGMHVRLQNFAWGGAKTVTSGQWGSECQGVPERDLPSTCLGKSLLLQVDDVPADTDVVMFTIGGNDVDFSTIVAECFSIVHDAAQCASSIATAESQISSVFARVEQIFEKLDQKLDDDAEVVYMGYPLLSTNTSEILVGGTTIVDAAQKIRELGHLGQVAQKSLVDAWNAGHPTLHVTYVDGVNEWFDQGPGHEPSPSPLTENWYRWMNEFFEVAGHTGPAGTTVVSGPSCVIASILMDVLMGKATGYLDAGNWYHPNITGHQQLAEILKQQIGTSGEFGIPATANVVTDASGDGPFAWIQGPYVAPIGSVVNLDARPSYAVNGDLVRYEWDYNGDGVYDETTYQPQVAHLFSWPLDSDIRVRVTDGAGRQAVGATSVLISEDGDTTPQDRDNCPLIANHGQGDMDNDGIGDLCDSTPGLPGINTGTASTPTPTPAPTGSSSAPVDPTPAPTENPTTSPSVSPTPTSGPTGTPTSGPTGTPTSGPATAPTSVATGTPTSDPTVTLTPTSAPTPTSAMTPTSAPTPAPTVTPASGPAGSVKYAVVPAGDTQVATGQNFKLLEFVSVSLCSDACTRVGSNIAGLTGSFTASFTVPQSTKPGDYTVVLSGARSGSVSVPFEVSAPPVPPTTSWITLIIRLWLSKLLW